MKKITSILVGALYCCSLNAQTDTALAEARYSFRHVIDTTQPENPVTTNMVLYLGKNMSRYSVDRSRVAAPGGGTIVGGTISGGTISGGTFVATPGLELANAYLKNGSENRMSYMMQSGYGPSAKLFSIDEPIPAINWDITSEVKTINNINCQKATARFKGRNYEAWFAPELPYSNGPWKLGGLPGLIVEASDTKKEVVFSLTSFKPVGDTLVSIAVPSNAVKTSPAEYKQYTEALRRDQEANRGAAGSVGVLSVTGVRIANVNGTPVKPRQNNNPIEKEN